MMPIYIYMLISLDILMQLSHLKPVPQVTLVDAIVGNGTLIYMMVSVLIWTNTVHETYWFLVVI